MKVSSGKDADASSGYMHRGEEQSTMSSIAMDGMANPHRPESMQQRSLAEELRMMNQMKEHIAAERRSFQIENGVYNPFDQVKANRVRAVPRQIDPTGTSMRVRPQTPKLNLLGKHKKPMQKRPAKLASIQAAPIPNLQSQVIQSSNSGFAMPRIGLSQSNLSARPNPMSYAAMKNPDFNEYVTKKKSDMYL